MFPSIGAVAACFVTGPVLARYDLPSAGLISGLFRLPLA